MRELLFVSSFHWRFYKTFFQNVGPKKDEGTFHNPLRSQWRRHIRFFRLKPPGRGKGRSEESLDYMGVGSGSEVEWSLDRRTSQVTTVQERENS